MQKTVMVPPHPLSLLANAVLHLANALDNPCGIAGVRPSCEAARDLVRDLAAPDHAEQPRPAPKRAIAFVRETRTRPDGSLETRERHGYVTMAPSCDAPHCACETGEDCHANGAADPETPAWTLTRDYVERFGDTLKLTDGREVIQYMIRAGTSFDDMREGLHALSDRLHSGKRTAPPAPDLDGHEADRVMVRAVEPSHPGPDDRDTWVLDPDATGHRAPFTAGDLVVRSSGRAGIHQVVAVSVDKDAARERSLRLKVEPQDVCVDRDAF